ncbi:MAG TPA: hypothetical protein IAB47_06315 [Candidatus Scatomorpha merdigallinarum]|nr:hypothetical protein [Candidatus Scatomorpha merdigallinarum]
METTTGNKTTRTALIIVSVLLVIGLAASCTLGALALSRIDSQAAKITELSSTLASAIGSNSDTVTQEDDVTVGGQYMIRSTLPISDAYKSGDTSALDEKQLETLNMASKVLDEIITEDMTPYDKEKAVYDWMCANLAHEGGVTVVIPTAPEYSAEPYGVLKYGAAVCVGFATTFRLFMQMMDIDCMVVHNSYHSWNLVNLDGDWYHTDIYSDVGRGNYANFNMTDEMCSSGHNWDTNFFPAANGLTYCYAYRSAQELTDIYTLPAAVREVLDADSVRNLYFIMDADKHTQQVVSALLGSTDSAFMTYAEQNGREMWMEYNMQAVNGKVLLSINITDYSDVSEEPTEELTEDEYARIGEAVTGAFGDVYSEYDSGETGVLEDMPEATPMPIPVEAV